MPTSVRPNKARCPQARVTGDGANKPASAPTAADPIATIASGNAKLGSPWPRRSLDCRSDRVTGILRNVAPHGQRSQQVPNVAFGHEPLLIAHNRLGYELKRAC